MIPWPFSQKLRRDKILREITRWKHCRQLDKINCTLQTKRQEEYSCQGMAEMRIPNLMLMASVNGPYYKKIPQLFQLDDGEGAISLFSKVAPVSENRRYKDGRRSCRADTGPTVSVNSHGLTSTCRE